MKKDAEKSAKKAANLERKAAEKKIKQEARAQEIIKNREINNKILELFTISKIIRLTFEKDATSTLSIDHLIIKIKDSDPGKNVTKEQIYLIASICP